MYFAPQFLYRRDLLPHTRGKAAPYNAFHRSGKFVACLNDARRGYDIVNGCIILLHRNIHVSNLAVMSGANDNGSFIHNAHGVQHGPFQIKVAVSLAKTDAAGGDGGSACDQHIDVAHGFL